MAITEIALAQTYPSREADKFMLRLPEGMRASIAERAKRNLRSMNAEIVLILRDAIGVSEATTGVQFGDQAPAAAHEAARKGDPVTHG